MIKVNFDGSCQPQNPNGTMGWGFTVQYDNFYKSGHGQVPAKEGNTNNIAEYLALMGALKYLVENKFTNDAILVRGDSMMVINQMKGDWQARDGAYLPYYKQCREIAASFKNLTFQWIPREKNQDADDLSKINLEVTEKHL